MKNIISLIVTLFVLTGCAHVKSEFTPYTSKGYKQIVAQASEIYRGDVEEMGVENFIYLGDFNAIGNKYADHSHVFKLVAKHAARIGATHIMLVNKGTQSNTSYLTQGRTVRQYNGTSTFNVYTVPITNYYPEGHYIALRWIHWEEYQAQLQRKQQVVATSSH